MVPVILLVIVEWLPYSTFQHNHNRKPVIYLHPLCNNTLTLTGRLTGELPVTTLYPLLMVLELVPVFPLLNCTSIPDGAVRAIGCGIINENSINNDKREAINFRFFHDKYNLLFIITYKNRTVKPLLVFSLCYLHLLY